jgi:SOS response regulatory protein OraA/RecX
MPAEQERPAEHERASAPVGMAQDGGDEREVAIDRAVRALARRDHSAAGLRAKLRRAGLSEQAQADAVETLERIGYVDDERFARDRAVRLAERGYGDDWIRADLDAQGVDAETVAAIVAGLEPEDERADRAAAAGGDAERCLRRLARRGFSEETIERLAAALHADGPKE